MFEGNFSELSSFFVDEFYKQLHTGGNDLWHPIFCTLSVQPKPRLARMVQSHNGTNIGHVEVTWDASNAASGIYFYKVTAGSFTDTKKMVLMK